MQIAMADKDGIDRRHHRRPGPGHRLGQERGLFSSITSTTPTTRCSSASRSTGRRRRALVDPAVAPARHAPDGSFAGVLIVSLDPYYLARFYETVDLGPGGTVMLVGRDGVVRARVAFSRAPGPDRPDAEADDRRERHAAARPDASRPQLPCRERPRQCPRVVSYSVLRDYPLMVGVGLSDSDLFAEYDASRWRLIGAAGAVSSW